MDILFAERAFLVLLCAVHAHYPMGWAGVGIASVTFCQMLATWILERLQEKREKAESDICWKGL